MPHLETSGISVAELWRIDMLKTHRIILCCAFPFSFLLHSLLPPEFLLCSWHCEPCKADLGTNRDCNRTELKN